MSNYYVYILANKRNGTLYVGITRDLLRRVHEHKGGSIEGFTKRYKVNQLVCYGVTTDIRAAIAREKQLKGGSRNKKIALIESQNPNWIDLYLGLLHSPK